MSLYALAQRTINTTAATPTWEIRSASTNKPRLMELGYSCVTAVAATMGFGRPAAIGTTPTTPQNFVAENDASAPTSLTTACVAWGGAPTVPANFNRRITNQALVGVGVIWTFPRGFDIAISQSVVLWVIATAPVLDAWAVIDE
jgi:hypothetical protein